jgi:hypothetical protein
MVVTARALALAMAVALAACSGGGAGVATSAPEEAAVRAEAEALCPLLWEFRLDVGSIANAMSRQANGMEDPAQRRQRYLQAVDELQQRGAQLVTDLGELAPGPYGDELTAQIEAGWEKAVATLEEMRDTIQDRPLAEEPPARQRISQLFSLIEKVIDLPQPELLPVGGEAAVLVYREVPSCQFAIKDVDDGLVRNNDQ